MLGYYFEGDGFRMSKEEGSRGRIGSNFNWRSFGGHIGGHLRA